MGKFVIKSAKNGDAVFTLKADNGQSILASEQYKSVDSCKKGIASVQKNCTDDKKFERKISTNQKHYFILKAGNGEPIGKSEMYETEASMEKGIASVMKNGTSTIIVEE